MPGSHATGKGRVTVKLFNMVAEEAGPGLLEKGVWIDGRQVRRIGERHPDIWPRIREARLDGQPFDPRQAFTHISGKDQPIRLTVHRDQPTTASRPHF
ncbi:hypothetical protein [Desulfosarcina cetonica]|uniref:hypothetical protein n=1 Tax=Desulfosarcina cetonica TaxID=90730 RepID=UPI0012ECC696|nr:hypothetical protein [Desulfosarcina cetonica]